VRGAGGDFLDVLAALLDEGAEFLVVGAHALAVHGVPRATGRTKDMADVETLLAREGEG
jgi:hypothetical protein